MRYIVLTMSLIIFGINIVHANDLYDDRFFETKIQAELKEKIRVSEYYKNLVSLAGQDSKLPKSNPIHPLHDKLHNEVFSKNVVDLPMLFQTIIFLVDLTQHPYEEKNFNSYFFDLQASALAKMANVSRLAKTETEKDAIAKEEEYKRLMKASLIRVAQWKILAEEDTYKCKYKDEALAFLKANLSKYTFKEDVFNLISRSELDKIALNVSDKFKDRPPNMPLCEMSKNYIENLKKTGTAIYATEQADGKVLIHMDTAKTPVKKNSKKMDVYLNTGQIKPEYVKDEDWGLLREKIRNGYSKVPLNQPVLNIN